MKRKISAALIGAMMFTMPACAVAQSTESGSNTSETFRYLNLFGDVFERVRGQYVEEVSDKELIEAAIGGMLSSLDPHSSYLNRDSFQDMQVQTRGEFGGLGIEVTMKDGYINVVSPIDDTPAHEAGIQAGDLLTHIDGETIQGLTLSEAVDKMRGKVGTDITVTVRRGEEQPFDVTITRDRIKIRSVRWEVKRDNIGYIRITTFNEQTQTGLDKALDEIQEQVGDDVVGYVIDMRNNPGGLLTKAISVSDTFLEEGEIVSTRGRDEEGAQRWNATSGDKADGKPLVVLINGGSASASEIVAGALKDHQRAILMGERSFGKGSVQTIIPMGGEGAMRLTTARYYTPAGTSIQGLGIEPDIFVPLAKIETIDTSSRTREADLRDSLENTDEQDGADATEAEETTDAAEASEADEKPIDYQLERALDMLDGLALFNRLGQPSAVAEVTENE